MSGPTVVDVFKECWVEDLDLGGGQRGRERKYCNIYCLFAVNLTKNQTPEFFLKENSVHMFFSIVPQSHIQIHKMWIFLPPNISS